MLDELMPALKQVNFAIVPETGDNVDGKTLMSI
jgi:hypothetical protein